MQQTLDPRVKRTTAARLASARSLYARASAAIAGIFDGRPAVYVCIALAVMAFCAMYVNDERLFPFWDLSAYQDQTFAVADAFARSFGEGARMVASSVNEDYNLLLTVPLVPLVWIFGETRLVYLDAVVAVYFFPFLLIAGAIGRRAFPERGAQAGIVAVVMAFATPLIWRNIMQGYADIGGAVLIGAMLLLYDRSERGARWKPILGCAVLAAISILFRRHYVWAAFALYVAFFVDIAFSIRIRRLREVLQAAAYVFGSGVVMLIVLYAIAPQFLTRITTVSYAAGFEPWQTSVPNTFGIMVRSLGVVPLLIAIAGMVMLPRLTVGGRTLARVITTATIVWALLWGFVVRQAPSHYPHTLPFFMIVGLSAAWFAARSLPDRLRRRAVSAAVAAALFLCAVVAVPFTPQAVALSAFTRYAAPDPQQPMQNPAYDEITRLIFYLRTETGPDDTIMVAAASHVFNGDLLQGAERSLFGWRDAKLHVLPTPVVDSRDIFPPAEAMTHATYALVAEPFQHHLRAEDQKVVHVVVDAFEQRWPAATDYKLLPDRFSLGPGVSVLVYKRTRPASIDVIADTEQRMADYMNGVARSASTVKGYPGAWVERSSPYPASVIENSDGTFRITTHPARRLQQPQTVFTLVGSKLDGVKVSGDVRFYEKRCNGAQLVFGTYYRTRTLTSAGTFTPGPVSHFGVALRHARGNALEFSVGPNPATPDDITSCTLQIDDLRVQPNGNPLSAGELAVLRSAAEPFPVAPESAASPAGAGAAAAAAAAGSAAVSGGARWTERSSPYPMSLAKRSSGDVLFSGHPTRRSQTPETVIETSAGTHGAVRITGTVRFYDTRCKGAQIFAGTDYGGADPPISAGVFTPAASGGRIDVVVRKTSGKAVYLNFKSNPRTPEDIDYCTLRIEGLQLAEAR